MLPLLLLAVAAAAAIGLSSSSASAAPAGGAPGPKVDPNALAAQALASGDPNVMIATANVLRSQGYAQAADQLAAAAQRKTAQPGTGPTPAAVNPASPLLTSTAAPGTVAQAPSGAVTYTVKAGDSAWAIAQRLVGSGARWKELVAANPQIARSADGNFKNIWPGLVLKLPASWTAAGQQATSGLVSPIARYTEIGRSATPPGYRVRA